MFKFKLCCDLVRPFFEACVDHFYVDRAARARAGFVGAGRSGRGGDGLVGWEECIVLGIGVG